MEKRWVIRETDMQAVSVLQDALGIHPVLCKLLVDRGIRTYDEAKLFFRPSLEHLHDPFLMKDMDKAVARIKAAFEQNERILIYGDYDVDGTTSVALMFLFLNPIYPNIDYYIPDRYKEGYGISHQGIDYAKENNCGLIIALDCGIKAIEQARAFYDFTNSVPHARALWLDASDMRRWSGRPQQAKSPARLKPVQAAPTHTPTLDYANVNFS